MHAVLVTIHSTVSPADMERTFVDHARAMDAIVGLVCTTWILAGARCGTYQVFSDRWAAEHYLGSDLFQETKRNAAFSDFEIRLFEVVDSLSLITVTPQARGS